MPKKQIKNQDSQRPSRAIKHAAQVRALASPTRNAIVQVIGSQGEASVREIAHQLGRQPPSLYKHIDILLDVGLIEQVGTEPTIRRDARIFTTDIECLRYAPEDPDLVEALIEFVESEMRYATRSLAKAYRSGIDTDHPVIAGPSRDTRFYHYLAWLSDDELASINQHIDAIDKVMRQGTRREGTKLVTHLSTLFPTLVTQKER